MNVFRKLSQSFYWLELSLLVLIPIAAVILSVLQIILRNAFETSLPWVDPMVRISVLWIGLLGAMIATRQSEHICIDVASHYLAEKWKKVVTVCVSFFASAICGLMAYHSWRFVIEEKTYQSVVYGEIPSWPFQMILPVAFVVMSFRFIVLLVDTLLNKKVEEGE